jgi:hypothetical protein
MHKADLPKYTLLGYTSEEGIDDGRGCDSETGADTLKEAKKKAKYWLTEDYMHACESSQRIQVVRILRDGEVLHEVRA